MQIRFTNFLGSGSTPDPSIATVSYRKGELQVYSPNFRDPKLRGKFHFNGFGTHLWMMYYFVHGVWVPTPNQPFLGWIIGRLIAARVRRQLHKEGVEGW